MKEFSHPGSRQKKAVDLNRAIRSTLTISRHEWKYVADVVTDFDPDLPPILCLPSDINQAVLNLVINAAQAIGEATHGGTDGKGTITVRTRRHGDWVEIAVEDTGTGIPAGNSHPRVRSVLHHQGSRPGHRPGIGHRTLDRRRPARRDHSVREPGGPRHDVRHSPADRRRRGHSGARRFHRGNARGRNLSSSKFDQFRTAALSRQSQKGTGTVAGSRICTRVFIEATEPVPFCDCRLSDVELAPGYLLLRAPPLFGGRVSG